MCGIVGYVGKRNCTDVLINGLSKLEYRGYDSAGIAVFQDGKIAVAKSKGRLKDLEDKMEREGRPEGNVGIGHTRWATHGEPSDVNSHPHSGGRVTIVHNGIIENYKELKDHLASKGVTFASDTDTEVVAKLLDYRYNGSPIQTISDVIRDLEGSYALGIIFADHPDQVYAVRCESPLIVGVGKGESFIASDVPAIIEYTRDYYLLEHEEIAVLGSDGVHIYDAFGQPVEKELKTADWDVEAIGKNGYAHFMLKEIHEQPTAIRNTILPRIQDGLPNLEECGITPEMLRSFRHIQVVACGTAMHAGTVGKYVIEKLARVPVTVDIASEFRYREPLVGEGDLVIIISQSGETADSLAAMRLAKSLGAKTLAIVNAMGSSIAREADMLIYTHAGPEIAVASTKAYMVQIAVMYLFAFELALAVGKIDETECRRLAAAPGYIRHHYRHSGTQGAGAVYRLFSDYRRQPAVYRTWSGLCPQHGRLSETERDLLYPLGVLCCRRTEARHHLAYHGKYAGDRRCHPESADGKDHQQHQGSQGSWRKGDPGVPGKRQCRPGCCRSEVRSAGVRRSAHADDRRSTAAADRILHLCPQGQRCG